MMDKSWMNLERGDLRYIEGINYFIKFAKDNVDDTTYICPCRRCRLRRGRITLDDVYIHLIRNGLMKDYTTWIFHGEVDSAPSAYMLREQYIQELGQQDTYSNSHVFPTMEIIHDMFPFRDINDDVQRDHSSESEANKFQKLVAESQAPIYHGSKDTLLDIILQVVQMKADNGWSDKSFDDFLRFTKNLLPVDNQFPDSYRHVKKILKNLGMEYQIIHACQYGCVLYYKEHEESLCCPVCNDSRYINNGGNGNIPKRVVRYFPLTPRLKRLFMSPHIAKQMRWHGERIISEGDIRHPADGKTWNDFNKTFPEFGNEIRNVRLGLATDGFNPFGSLGLSHSTWPIIVMPYNFPPSMCMKKEFNILSMLISGPKSPGKCLNVFMRPLIDELNTLWNSGACTYDSFSGSFFTMKAAVLWTISDFPGSGMLGGHKTKGYRACPICLDEIDAVHLGGTMCYQGHRRWLHKEHAWRRASDKFNGSIEIREAPSELAGHDVLSQIVCHDFPVQSMHPKFGMRRSNGLGWTHKTIFFELPYWETLKQPYSLDVMHIEKNVFDNIIGTILNLEGKTKDGRKARESWMKQGVHKEMWLDVSSSSKKVPQAIYTVSPEERIEILEWMRNAKYPSGYAGSLRNKINIADKKFIGLKTHDFHVIMQRLFPIIIRPYLRHCVVQPLIALSLWFQKLCCRELKECDVFKLKEEIVIILCKFERIFPPPFFTIMVHLLIHLPEHVLLKGPVQFNWMFPIERQLGKYKKSVRNTRYPEGCIAEQYIIQESITFCKLYTNTSDSNTSEPQPTNHFNISVYSNLINPMGMQRNKRLSRIERDVAHWCVMQNCQEVAYYIEKHAEKYFEAYPESTQSECINHFGPYFENWMRTLQNESAPPNRRELYTLACRPLTYTYFSKCLVNGIKFVVWDRDQNPSTQNCGVMVTAGEQDFYGVLHEILELKYAEDMPVVIFKCRWFNTYDPLECATMKTDRYGLLSVDTSNSWYEESPYCLAIAARQVFYLDDPVLGDNWKVVNVVNHRGIYSSYSLAQKENTSNEIEEPYQENAPLDISKNIPIENVDVDFGVLPQVPPLSPTWFFDPLHENIIEEDSESDEDVHDNVESDFEIE